MGLLTLFSRLLRPVTLLLLVGLVGCGGGSDPEPPVRPPPAGSARVSGSVHGGGPVVGATVHLIEAFAASATSSLQPLEDLASTGDGPSAVTDRDGAFSVDVPEGRYFVYVEPSSDDAVHLPGGSLSRESLAFADGSIVVLGIELSERPPDDATWVGSSRCLECHVGHDGVTEALHATALRGWSDAGPQLTALQSLARLPDADASLAYFEDGGANDNTGAPDDGYGYRVSSGEAFDVFLGRDGTGYFQAIGSSDGAVIGEPLYVDMSYGGLGRFRQVFLTRLDAVGSYTGDATEGTYHLLPAVFRETSGDPDQGGEVTAPGWVIDHADRWALPTLAGGRPAESPEPGDSFDAQCAGCHYTGFEVEVDGDGLVRADAVDDPAGAFDVDGDGEPDEIGVGCERCHGPGSRHAAEAQGHIVRPDFLGPGRANAVCLPCHVNGRGRAEVGGLRLGEYPSRDASGGGVDLPLAGASPAEVLGLESGAGALPSFGTSGGFYDLADLASDDDVSWLDRSGEFGALADHVEGSRSHGFDHARSSHALNPFEMLTCFDCHDSHEVLHPAQTVDTHADNVLCLRCHAAFGDFAEVTQDMVDTLEETGVSSTELREAIDAHTVENVFDLVGVAMNLGPATYGNPAGAGQLGRCTTCHMPKTGTEGGQVRDDEGFLIRGDLSSHVFDIISPDVSEAMATGGETPVPNSCVECHRGAVKGAWPNFRFEP